MAQRWEELKEEGNRLYKDGDYSKAFTLYKEAVTNLEANDNELDSADIEATETLPELDLPQDMRCDLAKLYSNLSVSIYQVAMEQKKEDQRIQKLEEALQYGEKAVNYDENFDKAYFRCALCLSALSRKDEMVPFVGKILALYKKNKKDYSFDKHLMRILNDCEYFTRNIITTPFWEQVKWKNNCKVIGKNAHADYRTLDPTMIAGQSKMTLILQPGHYRVRRSLVIKEDQDIQIIGDVRRKKDEVMLECTGAVWQVHDICHLFLVEGGMLSLSNLHLRQSSLHPELHAIYADNGSTIELVNCKCYSKCSGCIAANGNSKLTISECEFDRACGGVIVVGGSSGTIANTTFTDIVRIGVEARDGASMTVSDCKLSDGGSQAVTVHAAAKSALIERCTFTNNSAKLEGREPAVTCASGSTTIKYCDFFNNKGGAVMLQEGGYGELTNCTIRNGRYGVAASAKGEGKISNNTIHGTNYGMCIIFNQNGKIVLENNSIKAKIMEVMLSPQDMEPEVIGTNKPDIITNSAVSDDQMREGLLVEKMIRKSDHYGNAEKWSDPRKFSPHDERVCKPCGMTQRTLGVRFMTCSGCKTTWYCSKECQQKDWKLHKEICNYTQELLKSK